MVRLSLHLIAIYAADVDRSKGNWWQMLLTVNFLWCSDRSKLLPGFYSLCSLWNRPAQNFILPDGKYGTVTHSWAKDNIDGKHTLTVGQKIVLMANYDSSNTEFDM